MTQPEINPHHPQQSLIKLDHFSPPPPVLGGQKASQKNPRSLPLTIREGDSEGSVRESLRQQRVFLVFLPRSLKFLVLHLVRFFWVVWLRVHASPPQPCLLNLVIEIRLVFLWCLFFFFLPPATIETFRLLDARFRLINRRVVILVGGLLFPPPRVRPPSNYPPRTMTLGGGCR